MLWTCRLQSPKRLDEQVTVDGGTGRPAVVRQCVGGLGDLRRGGAPARLRLRGRRLRDVPAVQPGYSASGVVRGSLAEAATERVSRRRPWSRRSTRWAPASTSSANCATATASTCATSAVSPRGRPDRRRPRAVGRAADPGQGQGLGPPLPAGPPTGDRFWLATGENHGDARHPPADSRPSWSPPASACAPIRSTSRCAAPRSAAPPGCRLPFRSLGRPRSSVRRCPAAGRGPADR
jgi:hypothetical protein